MPFVIISCKQTILLSNSAYFSLYVSFIDVTYRRWHESEDVCVQGRTCTNKVLIHHRPHAQVTVCIASTRCPKDTGVIEKQQVKMKMALRVIHHVTTLPSKWVFFQTN